MILYLVHGNTWFEGYGYEEHVFGVFTTLVQAEAAKIVVEKRLQEEIERNSCIYVKDPEDVELQILEIKADELIDEYLCVEIFMRKRVENHLKILLKYYGL